MPQLSKNMGNTPLLCYLETTSVILGNHQTAKYQKNVVISKTTALRRSKTQKDDQNPLRVAKFKIHVHSRVEV